MQTQVINKARKTYERVVSQFPTTGRYWKLYIEHEVSNCEMDVIISLHVFTYSFENYRLIYFDGLELMRRAKLVLIYFTFRFCSLPLKNRIAFSKQRGYYIHEILVSTNNARFNPSYQILFHFFSS